MNWNSFKIKSQQAKHKVSFESIIGIYMLDSSPFNSLFIFFLLLSKIVLSTCHFPYFLAMCNVQSQDKYMLDMFISIFKISREKDESANDILVLITSVSSQGSDESAQIIWAATRGVTDNVSFKPARSATETSYKIEILLVASLYRILSNQ